MLTLALEAATYQGSVALLRGREVLAERTVAMRGEQEERLMPAVVEVTEEAGVGVEQLENIATGAGPGSFTSLRIAASIAKGMAVALKRPLLVAPSPLLVVAGATPALAPGLYCALLDAMRGDVYGLEVEVTGEGTIVARGESWLMSRQDAEARAAASGAQLVGPAESLAHAPHARGFARLLDDRTCTEVALAEWEPVYGRKAEAQVRWEAAHGRALEAR